MLGGGGSVANMVLVLLYRRGFYITPWNYVYLWECYGQIIVITTHEVMCDVRHRAKRRPSDWRREGNNPPGERR